MAIHWAAVMLAWLAGVAAQLQQRELNMAWPWLALLPGALALAWWGWPAGRAMAVRALPKGWRGPVQGRLGFVLACLVAASLGWAQAQWRAQQLARQTLPAALWPAAGPKRLVWLTGRVEDMAGRQAWGWTAKVRVQSWRLGEVQRQAGQAWALSGIDPQVMPPDRISLRLAADAPEPVPGEVWRWPVVLGEATGGSNPGGFDLQLWLWEQGIRAVGQVDTKGEAPTLLHRATALSPGMVERWRMALRQRILLGLSDARVASLVRGLTIGEQSAIDMHDWDTLRLTGTAHLAAISGLHITMMGGVLGVVVGWLWRRSRRLIGWVPAPTIARWATLLGAVLYALLAGWGVPAQRTVWMLLVVVLLRSSGRRWPWPLTLLLAAVVVTALDPWALVSAGFWLSFVAVGVLMWGGGDSAALPEGSRWAQWRHEAVVLWRTQRLASVGLAPLSLVFFQSVSIGGLGANLICIPWFTLVLTPLSMLGLIFSGFWQALQPLMLATLDALAWLARWHGSQWQVPSVHPWAAVLGVVGGAWLLAPWPWRWRFMGLPMLLPLLWSTSLSQTLPFPAQGEVDLLAADVGQGTSVLVRTARHSLLFDTGPVSRSGDDAGRRVLLGLMRATGVQALDEMVLSHGDADHTGGAASVLGGVPVKAMHTSLPPGHALLQTPDAEGRQPSQVACEAGQHWRWDGVDFDVMHPFDPIRSAAQGEMRPDNAVSCVLRVRAHGRQVLITGDIESAQEAEMAARQGATELASEVLLVPHHGSKTSSTDAFLAAVTPQVAVVQVGARNAYGHPHPKVMARYQGLGIPTVLTPRCGAWQWRSAEPPVEVAGSPTRTCWRELTRRYWHFPNQAPSP